MTQTFSPLCFTTKVSPNRTSPRNHIADTVTIHCYVGQVSLESAMNSRLYQAGSNASSNYIICTDGRIIGCVPEEDRSWCSSDSANDNRAITIECASDATHPYAINDKVMSALIDLLVDICSRNHIKALKFDKNSANRKFHINGANMTWHCDFAAKACPGQYLKDKHPYIAEQVNLRLECDRLNAITPYSVRTTAKIRRYAKIGDKVHDWTKINQKLIVSKIKVVDGVLWGKGLKSGLWFRLKYTKII